MQVSSGDRSNCCGTKEDGPFDSGRAETNKTNEGEYIRGNDRDLDLKGPTVTHPMVGVRGKDRKEGSETFEGLEGHMLRAAQTTCCCNLNIGKLELRKDFFPEKFVNHFACKRNYFALQSKATAFACWRKRKCGMYQCD